MAKDLKTLLREHKFTFKKAFGQNFLSDKIILDEIAESAGINKNDTVIEIGCGAGALTEVLAGRSKKVIGYEIDQKLRPVLDETVGGRENVEIIYKDVMKEKMADIEKRAGGEYLLVANLPYYITTPIVMRFLEEAKNLKGMAVTVQEEVAERFEARPGTADYGAITVAINLRGSAKIVKRIPREMFTPVPNVDSAVVKINIEKNKFPPKDLAAVRNLVRCGFSSRRKTLVNNMINAYKIERKTAEELLEKARVSQSARGETLSADQFVLLSGLISKTLPKADKAANKKGRIGK